MFLFSLGLRLPYAGLNQRAAWPPWLGSHEYKSDRAKCTTTCKTICLAGTLGAVCRACQLQLPAAIGKSRPSSHPSILTVNIVTEARENKGKLLSKTGPQHRRLKFLGSLFAKRHDSPLHFSELCMNNLFVKHTYLDARMRTCMDSSLYTFIIMRFLKI